MSGSDTTISRGAKRSMRFVVRLMKGASSVVKKSFHKVQSASISETRARSLVSSSAAVDTTSKTTKAA